MPKVKKANLCVEIRCESCYNLEKEVNRERGISELKTRVISGAVLIVITFTCVLLSPVTRIIFFAVAGLLCAYEYSRGLEKIEVYCCAWVMYVYICAQAILAFFHAGPVALIACFCAAVFLALFSGILHKKVSGSGALYTLAGVAYPCFLFNLLMVISVTELWAQTLIVGSVATWVCDTAALVGGSRYGKHKVAPLVSPHKTVEGCLFGLASSIPTALILYIILHFTPLALPLGVCLVTCVLASSMGQVGDLAESLIKRMIGVKDFSNLIPGHGGMFDRADSLLFAIPTAYLCLYIAGLLA